MSKNDRRKRPPTASAPKAMPLAAAVPAQPEPLPTPPRRMTLALAGLLMLTLAAFWPAVSADFITWDDPEYVTKNALLKLTAPAWSPNAGAGAGERAVHALVRWLPPGLQHIWSPFSDKNQQFYPLVFTSYWLEYRLFDRLLPGGALDARGYHATNLLLHLINVALVLGLLRRIGVSNGVALAGAAIFAVHPVQVASVVWIAERKNTLSGLFFLISFLLYLRHRRSGRWGAYAACLAAFLAALLSKTQTLTLPVSLALMDWVLLSRRLVRPARPIGVAARLLPMLALAFVFAQITTATERSKGPREVISTPEQRPLIAANAAWFYAGTFLAPVRLAPLYPKWNVDPDNPLWWAGLAAWPVVAALGWRFRRRLTGPLLWGAAHFFIILSPALGLIPFNYQQYTYVADHFLYLACIGGGVAVALAGELLVGAAQPFAVRRRRGAVVTAVGAAIVLACAALTLREARYWKDTETFWSRALVRWPDCFPANYNLGNHYRRQGRADLALPLYARAARIDPTNSSAFWNYTWAIGQTAGPAAVIPACDERLARLPRDFRARFERGMALMRLNRLDDARADFEAITLLFPPDSNPHRQARQQLNAIAHRLRPAPAASAPETPVR